MINSILHLGKNITLICVIFFLGSYLFSYASDSLVLNFTSQNSSGLGSNNSVISVDPTLSYINKGENSSIIGNYFTGYYHDSIFGYFKVDNSPNESENVRVVGSTGLCPTDYGYKLGGYAYSEYFGYVDFDYDENIFVYYCIEDDSLHGYAYSSDLGFQNFEGITFDIEVVDTLTPADEPTAIGAFINESTEILDEVISPSGDPQDSQEAEANNSNFNFNTIQNDIIEFDATYESLFYIIK